MAYSPIPSPDFPRAPEPPVLPPLESRGPTETVAPPNAEAIFSGLRGLIASAPRDPDMILGAIARAAQAITGSTGAAIAMRRDGVVICLSRSGETAPTLGARLGIDSGISGECLRIGKTLRCDDASEDDRADREVCQRLGLRSIVAVPLRVRGQTVGILEAFSTQPYAYTEEHIDSLIRLAELAEAAATDLAREGAEIRDPQTQLFATATQSIAPNSENRLEGKRRRRYRVAGVALAMLFLLSFVGWRVWRNSARGMAGAQQLTPARITQSNTNTEALSGSPPGSKPRSPGHLSNRTKKVPALRIAQPVTDTEVANSASRDRNAPAMRNHGFTPPALPAADVPAMSKIDASAASTDGFGRLLSAPATLPGFELHVSQGVSGGGLVHKVQPIYPPQELLLRLEGSVVLEATIAEDGTVSDVKVKSGHPVLARASMEAVSHWRYRPFLLNGKPIQKQEDIFIDFKLPH